MSIQMCQYGNCLEEIGEKGVRVSLTVATADGKKKAGFCCALHAAFALQLLSRDREENPAPINTPKHWRIS